ncbi:alpha amylase C-terminal domain-containing protein, partial [Bradyrhizobium sp.]|uniref:alpha amylase C-terminal domain-containing protein n=1 Tax=Bradyrhizobium sp. TaxID=376 RepID=UPI003C30F473
GCEFGQEQEWSHERSLDWHLLEQHRYLGIQLLVRDLNRLYRSLPALYELDSDEAGFEWIITEDAGNNVFAWMRKGENHRSRCLVIVNFSPVVHRDYHVRVPYHGRWAELLNSDSSIYGGSNVGNGGMLIAADELVPTLKLVLPPLGALFLAPEP